MMTYPEPPPVEPPEVSPRQLELLKLIEFGCDIEQCAEAMNISEWTVRQLTKRLLRKFPGRVNTMPERARAAGVKF